jgi:hypothetical protein
LLITDLAARTSNGTNRLDLFGFPRIAAKDLNILAFRHKPNKVPRTGFDTFTTSSTAVRKHHRESVLCHENGIKETRILTGRISKATVGALLCPSGDGIGGGTCPNPHIVRTSRGQLMIPRTGHERYHIRYLFHFDAENTPDFLCQSRPARWTSDRFCCPADQGSSITGTTWKTTPTAVHSRQNIAYLLDALIYVYVKSLAADSEEQSHGKSNTGENEYGNEYGCHRDFFLNLPGLDRKIP